MKRSVDGINLIEQTVIDAELIQFNVKSQRVLEISTKHVTNVNNTPNELIIYLNDDDFKPSDDALVEIRLYAHDQGEDERVLERLYQQIKDNTRADENADPIICVLPNLPFAVPRGRFNAHFAEKYVKLHGASFNYNIHYKNIIRAFWLELPERATGCFVLGFDKPLIQGQTDYKYTIIQFKTEEEIEIQMGPRYDELPKVNQNIERKLSGPYFEVFTRIFKLFTGLGVVIPGDFKNTKGDAGLACSVGAKQGHLFLLNKNLIFILKPVIYVKYEEIAKIIFHRVGSGHIARGFDIEVLTKGGSSTTFSSIDRSELEVVMKFFKDNNLLVEAAREDDIKDDEYEDDEEDEEEEIENSAAEDSEEEDDDFIAKDGDDDDEDEEEDGDFEGESDDEDDEPKPKEDKTTEKKERPKKEPKPPQEKKERKPKEPKAPKPPKEPKPPKAPKAPKAAKEPKEPKESKKNGHKKEPAK